MFARSTQGFSLAAMLLWVLAVPSNAQVLGPAFEDDYSLTELGSVTGLPPSYGGVFILASEPNFLYIGGAANTGDGALYRVPLSRDGDGRITGFAGSAEQVALAPFNDGGIVPDPGGLISYALWPTNAYGQIDLSTGTVVNQIDLTPFGVASASSSVNFIPPGYPGAGGMRIASWSGGQFYSADYSIGAGGIITLNSVTGIPGSTLPGGPEGWAYVPFGSPGFSQPSMLVAEYSAGNVSAFEMDANGNPIIASRRSFITGLSGAEGAAIDPVSGAFVFSTFGGGDRVLIVEGFEPPDPPPPPPPPPSTPVSVPVDGWWALISLIFVLLAGGIFSLGRRP